MKRMLALYVAVVLIPAILSAAASAVGGTQAEEVRQKVLYHAERAEAAMSGIVQARSDLAEVPEDTPGREGAAEWVRVAGERAAAFHGSVDGLEKLVSAAWLLRFYAHLEQTDAVATLMGDVAKARYETGLVKLRAATPGAWPFVVISTPVLTNDWFKYDAPLPAWAAPAKDLTLRACREEYESVSFILHAFEDRADVRVSVTELKGADGAIPPDALELRIVKHWYQAGLNGGGDFVANRFSGGVLVPEPLVKNDALIEVDHARRKNYVHTENGRFDVSDPALELDVKGRPLVEHPKLADFAPRDTPTLRPFDVPVGRMKQILVTAHVPKDARAGVYTGAVRVEAPRAGSFELPLSVEVLPFDLTPAPIDYSIYSRAYPVEDEPRYPVESYAKTKVQYRGEMATLMAHGIANPCVVARTLDSLVLAMQLREEAGMPKGNIYNLGLRIPSPKEELESHELRAERKALIRPMVEWAKENGYRDLYVYGIDESDEQLPDERPWIEDAHEVGAKVFVAVNQGAAFLELAGDVLDLPVLAGPPQPNIVSEVHARGNIIGIYANPQAGYEWPETYRRNYGVRLWQAGYDVEMTWCHQAFGHIWNDFDYATHKTRHMALPTVDGAIPTLSLVGFRESADDARYAATLAATAEQARQDPAKREEAQAALEWVRTVETDGNLGALRDQIIERVRRLLE